jgi:hypothetical protein
MEHPDRENAKSLKNRVLILLTAAIITASIFAFLSSEVVRDIRNGEPVDVVVFTNPPALISYNAELKKVNLAFDKTRFDKTPSYQTAIEIRQKLNPDTQKSVSSLRYFVPETEMDRYDFINSAKELIKTWKEKPLTLAKSVRAFFNGIFNRKTNVTIPEFISMFGEFTKLKISDLVVTVGTSDKNIYVGDAQIEKRFERPLVVEVLNAGDESGMAFKVTQHLRKLNTDNDFKIDILRYGNYKNREDRSKIFDYSGRISDISKVAVYLEMESTEIIDRQNEFSYVDAAVIIGRDFSLKEKVQ